MIRLRTLQSYYLLLHYYQHTAIGFIVSCVRTRYVLVRTLLSIVCLCICMLKWSIQVA